MKFHFGPFRYWFDAHKRTHHAELFDTDLKTKPQPPVFLQVSLTNYCNLRCSYCYAGSSPKGQTDWQYDPLLSVLQVAAESGLTAIAFGGGEAFTVPWFGNLLQELTDTTDLDLSVTTNGVLITPEIADMLEALDVHVRLSINSMKEYQHRRHGLEQLESSSIRFGINTILTPSNDFLPHLAGLEDIDVLLLKPQALGRGSGDILSDDQLKQMIFEVASKNSNGQIKISSDLGYLLNDSLKIHWVYPRELTRYPGFFGSISATKQLKHSSFCPDNCGLQIAPVTNPSDFIQLWQEVIERDCLWDQQLVLS